MVSIKQKILHLCKELSLFSSAEKMFILCVMLSAFLINAEYAITRPVSNSLFIQAYTAHLFPYAWLAGVPLNFFCVSLYNHFLPKNGPLKMCRSILLTVMVGNVLTACFISYFSSWPFFFYVWKEIYILLMFQQLWSIIHFNVNIQKAKYLYGMIFGVGGLGAALGSMIPGFLAVKIGSEFLLFFNLPLYALLYFFYSLGIKQGTSLKKEIPLETSATTQHPSFLQVFKLFSGSRFLVFILAIVILMQITSTLIDFQFNSMLEKTILDKDIRTAYFGRVMGLVQIATIFLQFIGTFFLVQSLGIRYSHLSVPLLLGLNAAVFLVFPAFGMIVFSFIAIKSFDFSLFGIIKEMLYVPLKTDEKFRAKAIIDVFAYRTAKALASFIIICLQLWLATSLISILSGCILALFILWAALVYRWLKKEDLVVY